MNQIRIVVRGNLQFILFFLLVMVLLAWSGIASGQLKKWTPEIDAGCDPNQISDLDEFLNILTLDPLLIDAKGDPTPDFFQKGEVVRCGLIRSYTKAQAIAHLDGTAYSATYDDPETGMDAYLVIYQTHRGMDRSGSEKRGWASGVLLLPKKVHASVETDINGEPIPPIWVWSHGGGAGKEIISQTDPIISRDAVVIAGQGFPTFETHYGGSYIQAGTGNYLLSGTAGLPNHLVDNARAILDGSRAAANVLASKKARPGILGNRDTNNEFIFAAFSKGSARTLVAQAISEDYGLGLFGEGVLKAVLLADPHGGYRYNNVHQVQPLPPANRRFSSLQPEQLKDFTESLKVIYTIYFQLDYNARDIPFEPSKVREVAEMVMGIKKIDIKQFPLGGTSQLWFKSGFVAAFNDCVCNDNCPAQAPFFMNQVKDYIDHVRPRGINTKVPIRFSTSWHSSTEPMRHSKCLWDGLMADTSPANRHLIQFCAYNNGLGHTMTLRNSLSHLRDATIADYFNQSPPACSGTAGYGDHNQHPSWERGTYSTLTECQAALPNDLPGVNCRLNVSGTYVQELECAEMKPVNYCSIYVP